MSFFAEEKKKAELTIPSWQGLRDRLNSKIFEQDDAVTAVVAAHQRMEAGLVRAEGPMASMLFLGPTGSGKTELAKVWSRYLGLPFKRYDMSAFSEAHTASSLIGAPPGYMGSNQPSQLASDLGGHEHFVILLDEIEKAHPDVIKLFLSVLDTGLIKDRSGNDCIDFRGAVIIMTSNAGLAMPREIGLGASAGFQSRADVESVDENVSDEKRAYAEFMAREKRKGAERRKMISYLQNWFPPEFLGRISNITHFNPLSESGMGMVLNKKLKEMDSLPGLASRGICLALTETAKESIVSGACAEGLGARPISHILERHLVPIVARTISGGGDLEDVKNADLLFSVKPDGSGFYIKEVSPAKEDRLKQEEEEGEKEDAGQEEGQEQVAGQPADESQEKKSSQPETNPLEIPLRRMIEELKALQRKKEQDRMSSDSFGSEIGEEFEIKPPKLDLPPIGVSDEFITGGAGGSDDSNFLRVARSLALEDFLTISGKRLGGGRGLPKQGFISRKISGLMQRLKRRKFRFLSEGDSYLTHVNESIAGGRVIILRQPKVIICHFMIGNFLFTVKERVLDEEFIPELGISASVSDEPTQIVYSLLRLNDKASQYLLLSPRIPLNPLGYAMVSGSIELNIEARSHQDLEPMSDAQRELVRICRQAMNEADQIATKKQLRR